MATPHARAVVLAALLCLTGCGGGEAPSSSALVTDSAGVTIVTNTPARVAGAPRWTLADRPGLAIESPEDGAFNLYQVGDVVGLSGGRIAVANAGTSEILLFGPDGSLATRFGAQGDGPGEFGRLTSVAELPGDSLAVWDMGAHRLSVFDDEGRLAHDVDLGPAISDAHGSFANVRSLASGDLVLFTGGDFNSDRGPHEGAFRAESESMRIASDGSVQASYGLFPGLEVFVGQGAMGRTLFGPMTEAVTAGDDLVDGRGEEPELRVYAPSGALLRVVRWPDHERPVTQDRMEALLDTATAQVPEAQKKQMRSMMASFPHPDREPPYETLLASAEGDLWVGDYRGPEVMLPDWPPPARHWLVFAPDGTLAARIDTPAGFEPRLVRDARVVGVFKDDLGVESLRAYAIQGM